MDRFGWIAANIAFAIVVLVSIAAIVAVFIIK